MLVPSSAVAARLVVVAEFVVVYFAAFDLVVYPAGLVDSVADSVAPVIVVVPVGLAVHSVAVLPLAAVELEVVVQGWKFAEVSGTVVEPVVAGS